MIIKNKNELYKNEKEWKLFSRSELPLYLLPSKIITSGLTFETAKKTRESRLVEILSDHYDGYINREIPTLKLFFKETNEDNLKEKYIKAALKTIKEVSLSNEEEYLAMKEIRSNYNSRDIDFEEDMFDMLKCYNIRNAIEYSNKQSTGYSERDYDVISVISKNKDNEVDIKFFHNDYALANYFENDLEMDSDFLNIIYKNFKHNILDKSFTFDYKGVSYEIRNQNIEIDRYDFGKLKTQSMFTKQVELIETLSWKASLIEKLQNETNSSKLTDYSEEVEMVLSKIEKYREELLKKSVMAIFFRESMIKDIDFIVDEVVELTIEAEKYIESVAEMLSVAEMVRTISRENDSIKYNKKVITLLNEIVKKENYRQDEELIKDFIIEKVSEAEKVQSTLSNALKEVVEAEREEASFDLDLYDLNFKDGSDSDFESMTVSKLDFYRIKKMMFLREGYKAKEYTFLDNLMIMGKNGEPSEIIERSIVNEIKELSIIS